MLRLIHLYVVNINQRWYWHVTYALRIIKRLSFSAASCAHIAIAPDAFNLFQSQKYRYGVENYVANVSDYGFNVNQQLASRYLGYYALI